MRAAIRRARGHASQNSICDRGRKFVEVPGPVAVRRRFALTGKDAHLVVAQIKTDDFPRIKGLAPRLMGIIDHHDLAIHRDGIAKQIAEKLAMRYLTLKSRGSFDRGSSRLWIAGFRGRNMAIFPPPGSNPNIV